MQFDTLVQLQEMNLRWGSGDDHVIKVLDRHREIRVHFPAAPQTSFMMSGISLCCSIKLRKYFLNAQESREAGFFKHLRCTVVSEEAQLGEQMPSIPMPRTAFDRLLGPDTAWAVTTVAGTGEIIPLREISSEKLNPIWWDGKRFQSQSKYKTWKTHLRWQKTLQDLWRITLQNIARNQRDATRVGDK